MSILHQRSNIVRWGKWYLGNGRYSGLYNWVSIADSLEHVPPRTKREPPTPFFYFFFISVFFLLNFSFLVYLYFYFLFYFVIIFIYFFIEIWWGPLVFYSYLSFKFSFLNFKAMIKYFNWKANSSSGVVDKSLLVDKPTDTISLYFTHVLKSDLFDPESFEYFQEVFVYFKQFMTLFRIVDQGFLKFYFFN